MKKICLLLILFTSILFADIHHLPNVSFGLGYEIGYESISTEYTNTSLDSKHTQWRFRHGFELFLRYELIGIDFTKTNHRNWAKNAFTLDDGYGMFLDIHGYIIGGGSQYRSPYIKLGYRSSKAPLYITWKLKQLNKSIPSTSLTFGLSFNAFSKKQLKQNEQILIGKHNSELKRIDDNIEAVEHSNNKLRKQYKSSLYENERMEQVVITANNKSDQFYDDIIELENEIIDYKQQNDSLSIINNNLINDKLQTFKDSIRHTESLKRLNAINELKIIKANHKREIDSIKSDADYLADYNQRYYENQISKLNAKIDVLTYDKSNLQYELRKKRDALKELKSW